VTIDIEGTISQGVHVCDLRHARYRGLIKTHLQHVFTAIAINVARLVLQRHFAKIARSSG